MTDGVHQVYGVKFAHNPNGTRGQYFYGSGREPIHQPAPLDYFVWLIRSDAGDVVVDAGFTAKTAARIRRDFLHEPTDGLRLLGVDPQKVQTLLLTHFHFDHTGTLPSFPHARVVAQESEMAFWTGPSGARPEIAHHLDLDDLTHLVRLNYENRIHWVDGDAEILPGISVHLVDGHTPGSQAIRVRTANGPVLLAGDAAHFYEEVEEHHPFAIFTDLPSMYRSFERMIQLAEGGTIVPGHDPRIIDRFPAVPGHQGVLIRIA